jgi:alpha-tubulin suppressor-like RCC1 family protein
LTNVVAIASRASHALALKKDGTVVAWGYITGDFMNPNYGQVSVPAGLSNVVAIATGVAISMAVKKDGTVAVWGDNHHHQVDLAAGLSNIVAIAAGKDYCLAIQTTNGTLVETNIPPATIKP